MGIFDIFKRDEEYYKGYKLSSDVDVALQKQLIDRGRGNEVNSLTTDAIKKANSSINVVANSTPAIISTGKNSLAPEPVKVKDVAGDVENKIFSNPKVQNVLEKTVGKLQAVDDSAEGKLLRDDGQPILVQDLPLPQQIAGSVFHVFKNIGRGEVGTLESTMRGFQWLGVEEAKPIGDKLGEWQKAVAPENPTFADNLSAGIGSAVMFFAPGIGVMKGAQAIGAFSPRLAMLFGNSAMTAFEALTEAGDSYQTALDQGKTKKDADNAATKVFWANAALIGLTNKLAYFNKIPGLKKLLVSSPVEGLQEFGQQIIQNVTSGRKWDEGAYEAGAIGTILGGMLGGSEIGMDPIKENEEKKIIEPSLINDQLKDIAEKVGLIQTGNVGATTGLSQKILDLANGSLSAVENPAQFYSEVAKVIKNDPAYTPEMLNVAQGLAGTMKTLGDQIKADPSLYKTPGELNLLGYRTADEKSAISAIANRYNLTDEEADKMFVLIKDFIRNESNIKKTPEIFDNAVAQVKMETGAVPDIIQQAIKKAKADVIIPAEEEADLAPLPAAVYHQTNEDAEAIKDRGFQMGKNSAFGEAAFFGERANNLYGDNQLAVNPSDFKLKKFNTVKEQQEYVAKNGGEKLADAIRKEGKYDGFIIPNAELGGVFGITNKEKLDEQLRKQQFITTDEARAMSKNFRFIEELGLPVNTVEKILTPDGREAFGRYYKGAISFIENPHKTTIPHEAVHAFIDLMLTSKQKKTVLNEIKRRYAGKNFTDQQAEEQLAEDFAKYYTKKFDDPATAKAPSSKIKQFFDWLIEQFKKLVGKGDVIEQFYKDVETKKPGIIQREIARRRIKRGGYNLEDLQKEYFQNPDALTTKFLENVDVKHRETASYEFLKNLLKSKTLPLKEVERNLIDDILDEQFKDEKKINMDDFRNSIRTELMPLQVIESESYADYGAEHVDMSDYQATTHIYNSPFFHGYTGHFGGDFARGIRRSEIEVKQIPTTDKWAVINKGTTLTSDNVSENVFHVAASKEKAESWVEDHVKKDVMGGEDVIDVGNKGLFGHTRIWDETEKDYYKAPTDRDNIRYISEIQSDAFQNLERVLSEETSEKIQRLKDNIAKFEREIDDINNKSGAYKNTPDNVRAADLRINQIRIDEWKKELFAYENKALILAQQKTQKDKFLQFKNTWHERLIREEIRRAAMDGKSKLRIPTPYTVAKIEGYLSEEGQIPENTEVGDEFDYMGDNYTLLSKNEYYDGSTGIVTRSDNVRTIVDFDTARQEDFDNEMEEMVYEIKNAKTSDDINSIADGYFTKEQIKELRGYIKNDEEAEIEGMLEPVINARIDDRYTDNEGYANYYNDMFGGDEKGSFPLDENRIIILEKTETETLSFGQTEADKENFDYEKDLDSTEQRTVARFYDKQVGRYLAKLRKQNFRIATDDRGYEWYETDILPEDKAAVEAFQVKPAEEPLKRTGKQVADYLEEIENEKDPGWERDDYLLNLIKKQDFYLKSVKIDELIKQDKNLKDYIREGVNRYEDTEDLDPDLPVIVGYWDPATKRDYGVLDGYNRILTKKQSGNEYVEAWVANQVNEIHPEDYKTMISFIDYARLNQPENVKLEIDARYLAEGLNINPDLGNGALANRFEKVLSAQPKYQVKPNASRIEPSRAADLEYRRQQENEKRLAAEYEKEASIISARETDLSFTDSEKEAGYQNFKKLARRRRWILDNATDEMTIKFRMRGMNIDNYLFSGATDMTSNDLLEMFKDRYFQEEEIASTAKGKTPTEEAAIAKAQAERLVRKETVGRKPTIKNAINVAMGEEAPKRITMKETTLLRKKIRDMARGVRIGRSAMRETLIEAFRTKQENVSDIKKAIINYAGDLPSNEKGRLLPMVANAKTQLDLTKAMLRVDAALQRIDKNEQLQAVRDAASEVRAAVRTGRGIAVDYQKRLVDILSDYDLKKPTARTLSRLQSLKEYLDDNPGFVPDYVVKQLDRLSKRNPGQMTTEEIKDLNDTLNRLIALGHLKLQLKNNYDERVKQANLAKLLTNTKSLDPRGDTKDDAYNRREAKKKMYIHSIHAFRVTDMIDGYVDYKGQNTRLQRLIASKVNNAELTANSLLRSVFDEIKAIKNRWTDKEQAIMEFHLLVQQGAHTQANELATVQGWKEAPKLTPEMEIAMDLMRGTFQKTEDYLAAVYEELNNKPFEKVENYFPLKYEQRKGEIPEPTIGQKFLRSSQTEQGFTFKRLPNVKRTPRVDVFAQFEEAVREQQYFMHVQPALLEVRSLVNDDAYKNKAGRVVTNWWRDYIDAMSNRGQLSGVRSNAWLRHKRIQLSRAILGYKLSSVLMQPLAIFDAVAYVQMRFGQTAAARLLLHFANTWINPFYARKVLKLSPSIQLRKGTAGELAVEEIAGTSRRKKISEAYNRLGLKPLQYFDLKTAASVDQAVFKILRGKGLSESDARAEADLIMNIVSGSSEVADRPMVLMSGEGLRTIFTFQTFMLNRWGLIAHDIINSGLIHGSLGRKARAIYALFILALAGGVENELRAKLYELMSGKALKNQLSFWKGAFLSIPEAVPILGQIIQGYGQAGQSFSVPLTRTMENFRLGTQQIFSDDAEKRKKGFIRLGEAIATWNGISGSAQIADLIERGTVESAPKRNSEFDIELPALPEIELPELPELPALPAL